MSFFECEGSRLLNELAKDFAKLKSDVQFIKEEVIKLGTSQAQFDTALANLQTQLAAGITTIQTALNDLIAKVQAGTPVDLTAELGTVSSMAGQLAAIVATATNDDPGASAPAQGTSTASNVTSH